MKRSAFGRSAVRGGIGGAITLCLAWSSAPSFAAEDGQSFFIGGVHGALAGVTPPPGFYFSNSFYVYGGNEGANHTFQLGTKLVAGVRGDAELDLPTLVWVTPATLFGGSLGFNLSTPFGRAAASVNATLTGPRGLFSRSGSASDSTTTFGDPILGAFVGWSSGNFHWQIAESVNVPIGDYQSDALTNVALHRWVGDTSVSATWLDPAIGIDVSGATGITFNGNNPSTDYRTGTEFHVEGAVSKYLSKDFSIGPSAYFYDQLTGDSGSGDKLGSFEGRVAALGGVIGYNFVVDKIPISTSIKVYREFDVQNRLEGTAGWFTVSIPLGAFH
jgi:hypothetical protein